MPVNDYEMPLKESESLERARAAGFSFSYPNDYSEPLFDSETSTTLPNDHYSSPLDALQPACQVITPSANVAEYSEAFVPPACNVKLLLAQIKQANVKMISSKNVRYVLCYIVYNF